MDLGDTILISFYGIVFLLSWFWPRPRVVFYIALGLSLLICALLFHFRIYLELGGLAHTLPYAILARLLSTWRARRARRPAP